MPRQRIIPRIVWGAAAFVVTGLLSLNAWFAQDFIVKVESSIEQLKKQTESTNDKMTAVYVRLAIIETKMADLKATMERRNRFGTNQEDANYGTSQENGQQLRAQRINQIDWR